MQKLVFTGVLTFGLGLLVGRATVVGSSAPSVPPTPVAQPSAAPALVPSAGTLSGRVAEVLQVSQYTYLRLESGEWAAVSSVPDLQPGAQVTVSVQTELQDFSSPSLNRTFARIAFGTLGSGDAVAAPDLSGALAAVKAPAVTLRVEDVFAGRTDLNGQRVRVKGTVDRVNEVQGVFYVHLKDGSGSAASKDDDLLCISKFALEKGAAVTLEGTVGVERNVGMGTNPVVLDDVAVR